MAKTRIALRQVGGTAEIAPSILVSTASARVKRSEPCNGRNRWTNCDAQTAVAFVGIGESTAQLLLSGFVADIPDDATILGIELHVERWAGKSLEGSKLADQFISIFNDGRQSESETPSIDPWDDFSVEHVYGSPTELWGLEWRPSDFLNGAVEVGIVAKNYSSRNAIFGFVGEVKMLVHYAA